MRLSSSSEEIATASTSRSVRSAKFFTVRRLFSISSLCLGGLQELDQKPAHFARLLLLYPMAGAIDEMAADHVGAGFRLHRFIDTWALIGAPVLLARDEGGGDVDGAAGPQLQIRRKHAGRAAAIPLQAALKAAARIFGSVERKLAVRQPCVGGDFGG